MTESHHERASRLFLAACDLAGDGRANYLDRECGGDAGLREQVEGLLAADADPEALLDESVDDLEDLIPSARSAVPDRIGRYRVTGVLGRGGMGVVYAAEQDQPRRRVALKVLSSGFADESMYRRFDHEAAVLGWLSHPNIAQIYEAGTVEDGERTPYFAMEYIGGVPICEYTRQHALTVREQVELLLRVCEGVRHAHQKGIVHRDLKPANILVTEAGLPKILDFGIARSVDSDLRLTTVGTLAGEILGTLSYMSPEQVRADPAEIDTRSDVYSLGVVAYEMLSGKLPLETRDGSLPEAMRRILEDEPTRLGTLNGRAAGDIETIVGKALEKEKEQRYASVDDFAADLTRYLKSEPIVAHPPSTVYQLKKFARRNRTLVAGVLATFLALVAGAWVSTWRYWREQDALATANETITSLTEVQRTYGRILRSPHPMEGPSDIKMMDVLAAAEVQLEGAFPDKPVVRARLLSTLGSVYSGIGAHREALALFQEANELHESRGADWRSLARTKGHMARALEALGRGQEALRYCEESLGLYEANDELDADRLCVSYWTYGMALLRERRYDDAIAAAGKALEHLERARFDVAERRAAFHGVASRAHWLAGHEDQAIEHAEAAIAAAAPDDPGLAFARNQALNTMAVILASRGQIDEALPLATEAFEGMYELAGPDHPQTSGLAFVLGQLMQESGDEDGAAEVFGEVIRMREDAGGRMIRDVPDAYGRLARIQFRRGDDGEAKRLSLRALETAREVRSVSLLLEVAAERADLMREMGETDAAREALLEALDVSADVSRLDPSQVGHIELGLAQLALEGEDWESSRTHATRATELFTAALGPGSGVTLGARSCWSLACLELGDDESALEIARESWASATASIAPGTPEYGIAQADLGWILLRSGLDAEGRPLLVEGVRTLRASIPESPYTHRRVKWLSTPD